VKITLLFMVVLVLKFVKKWQNHFFEKASLRSAPRLSDLSGQFDFAPSRRYDSRALTGAPIVPLPRNWLASSATGGASPISMRVAKNTSQPASVRAQASARSGVQMEAQKCAYAHF
jgi:hypothetical protein